MFVNSERQITHLSGAQLFNHMTLSHVWGMSIPAVVDDLQKRSTTYIF